MKIKYIIGILCLCFIAACTEKAREVKVYTADELRDLIPGTYSVGVTYEKFFEPYSAIYSLTDTENRLVGIWTGFEDYVYREKVPHFVFYPNKFFLGRNNTKWYKVSKDVTLEFGYGIWETKYP